MIRMVQLPLGALVLLLPALLDSSLKGVGLLAGLALIALAMRRASAAARHLVWLLGIAGLLALPIFSFVLPNWRVLPSWIPAPASTFARVSETLQPSTPSPLTAARDNRLALAPPPATGLLASSTPTAAARPGRREAAPRAAAWWLGGLWAVGAGLLILRLLACSVWLRIVTRRAETLLEGPLAEALAAARADLDVRRPVRLLLDERRIVPLVWGVRHPRLILPGEACAWAPSRLRAVLLHELAHVKRHDLPALWLTQIACAIHWFNPLVWLAAWRLHVERERACDDLVLGTGVRGSDYAEHLLHVATKLELGGSEGALAMARPAGLERRLMAVLNERLNRRGVSRGLVLATVAAGLCVLVPVAMLKAADKEPTARDSAETAGTRDREPTVERQRPEVALPEAQHRSWHPNAEEERAHWALLADLVRSRLQQAESELDKATTADLRDRWKQTVVFLENELTSLTADRSQSKTDQEVADSASAGQATEPVEAAAVVVPDPNQQEPKANSAAPPDADTLFLDIADDGSLQLAGKAVTLEALDEALAAERKAKPELKVAIRASAQAAYAGVVRVLDTLKEAQVTSVSLQARGDDAKEKAGPDSTKDNETGKIEILRGPGADAARAELASAQARLKRISDLVDAARVEHAEAEAAVNAAQARLQLAEGDLRQVPAGAPPAGGHPEAKRHSAEAEVAAAEVDLARVNVETAAKRFQRIQALADQAAVSETEREDAEAALSKSQASLRVAEARYRFLVTPKRTVTVLGQVNKPGLVDLPPGQEMDLLEAIAFAQGTTRLANTRRVEVTRRGRLDKLNLDELRRLTDPGKKYWLEPGDVIFVPESVF